VALGLAARSRFSSYYESDAIGPIDLWAASAFTQLQINDLTAATCRHPAGAVQRRAHRSSRARAVTLWPRPSVCGRRAPAAIGTPYWTHVAGRRSRHQQGAIFILMAGHRAWFARSDRRRRRRLSEPGARRIVLTR
jgi:hypothetical protein